MTVITSRPFSKSYQYFELGGFSTGYVIATSELADSQVSSFSSTRTISLSLVASQSVTSLRSLNREIAKTHPSVWQGLFRAWWLLNQLCHCDLWTGRKPSLIFQFDKNYYFELGGFSIGYVIATFEPADSQVSSFSPIRTTSSLVASQSVKSLRLWTDR